MLYEFEHQSPGNWRRPSGDLLNATLNFARAERHGGNVASGFFVDSTMSPLLPMGSFAPAMATPSLTRTSLPLLRRLLRLKRAQVRRLTRPLSSLA